MTRERSNTHRYEKPQEEPVTEARTENDNSDILKDLKLVSDLADNHPVSEYMRKRQIPEEAVARLYYAPKFMTWAHKYFPGKLPKEGKEEPRIIIPFRDKSGRLIGMTARGFRPKGLRYITLMLEDVPKIYGLDRVDFNRPYLILEGAIDSMFLDNAVAMAGADGNTDIMEHHENGTFVFDNEPRNREIHNMMQKVISKGFGICIWPQGLPGKDVNEMILNGVKDIRKIIDENTHRGLQADLALSQWRRT